MKAAVPIYNNDVAPRFGFADSFLIGEIVEDRLVDCVEVRIKSRGWPERIEEIRHLGIDTLLCCGFNRRFIPFSQHLGIQVITGLTGDGRDILARFARGELDQRQTGRVRCTQNGRRQSHPRDSDGPFGSSQGRGGSNANGPGRNGQGQGQGQGRGMGRRTGPSSRAMGGGRYR